MPAVQGVAGAFRPARRGVWRVPGARYFAGSFLLLCLATVACVASPQSDASEQAIRRHFEQMGYAVVELSLGELRRNPVDERVYMAPLTYVVRVRSITLAAQDPRGGHGQRTSRGATVKVQVPGGTAGGGEGDWVVSAVEGIELP